VADTKSYPTGKLPFIQINSTLYITSYYTQVPAQPISLQARGAVKWWGYMNTFRRSRTIELTMIDFIPVTTYKTSRNDHKTSKSLPMQVFLLFA
jgi:hypothetical protein